MGNPELRPISLRVDKNLVIELLKNSMLTQRKIAKQVNCSLSTVEAIKAHGKVQRPECYKASVKMNETRSKLVGSKWNRSGEPSKRSEDMV